MNLLARKGFANTALLLAFVSLPVLAHAKAMIEFLPTQGNQFRTGQNAKAEVASSRRLFAEALSPAISQEIRQTIEKSIDLNHFRAVRVQTIQDEQGHIDHLLVQLHALTTHRVDLMRLELNSRHDLIRSENIYSLQEADTRQQPGIANACPDPAVQFIAFAPNDDALELQITRDVAAAAKSKGLKTVELYTTQATRAAYLSYMSCPNIKGNFYDGDANPQVITTSDGVITSAEISALRFNFHVTNIWLACQAFNDPMLSSVTKDAHSQKYAAGINDLLVGPSDRTAKCAMIQALNGAAMTQAFQTCYHSLDDARDQWGFNGSGSDIFGQ